MSIELTTDEMFFAMQFYTLQFLDMLEMNYTSTQFIGETSRFEGKPIIYAMGLLGMNDSTTPMTSMCFTSKDSFHVIFNSVDLNVVFEDCLSLGDDGNIVYDRQRFANSNYGRDIRVDLDMCTTDYIKSTDDYKKYKRLNLLD